MPRQRARISPRPWRTRCVWLLAAALLWAVLAPQLAPLLRAVGAGSATWVEVCSGMATRLVQLDAGAAPGTSDDGDLPAVTADCPWCRLHVSPALPPDAAHLPGMPAPALHAPLPRKASHIAPTPPWRPALARAPPATTPV